MGNDKSLPIEEGTFYDVTICPACHQKLDFDIEEHRIIAILTEASCGSAKTNFHTHGPEEYRKEVED